MTTVRDLQLAAKARAQGARYALTIIAAARAEGLPISAAFALIEGESNFKNIFGHDRATRPGDGKYAAIKDTWAGKRVTKRRYLHYKKRRPAFGMQGVGPAQLTWFRYQDDADARGGGWKGRVTIPIGIGILADHFRETGDLREAARRYNGSGPAAEKYADDFMVRQAKWHKILT